MNSHRDSSTLHIFATAAELSKKVGAYIAQLSADIIEHKGSFTIALSGGSMPKLLAPIAAPPLRDQIKWTAWSVFWSDERCVPLEHPDSNYRGADEFIFSQVNIPDERIFALDDSLAPAEAAEAYQALLGQVFQPLPGQWPEFDLILLGLGEDGHTASLFPDHPLLEESTRWVAPILNSPKPPPERITLTLPLINHAKNVVFMATGAGKAEALRHIFEPTVTSPKLPAGLVQPTAGNLQWFIDRAAAAKLSG